MNMKTKIKAILTIIFSSVLILSMSACKTNKETDLSSSEPTASTSVTTTTSTLPTTTTATTTTTRKTTTSKATTTTTTATTTVTTTTTAPTATQLTTTTVATTTTTAVPVVATTTTTTTAAPIVATTTTTAPAPITTGTQTETWIEDGEIAYITMVPYTINDPESSLHGTVLNIPCEVEEPLTPTEQAYFDLADKGILTDEIRELITADVLNYATSKYEGLIINPNLYAKSQSEWNCSFDGGARNDQHGQITLEMYSHHYDYGDYTSVYDCGIIANKKRAAQNFQKDIYSWVDETLVNGSEGIGCYVDFCYFYTENENYNVYQLSFLVGRAGLV